MPLLEDLFYGQPDLGVAVRAGQPARGDRDTRAVVTELELDELGPAAELALTPDQGRLLAASGVVSAAPSPYVPGRWLVGPAGKVGAARVGDVVVRIKPKVEIARLLFMLGYSLHGAAWQASAVDVGEAPDLVPAIAQALWRQVSRAIHQGLLPGYVTREESSLGAARPSAGKRAAGPASRAAAAAGDQARRVHRGHPREPDPAHGLRADAARAPGGRGVRADAAAAAARLRGRPLDSAW